MNKTIRFVIGREYLRRDLHAIVGGQRQGGISTPRHFPVVLLFTGESGEQYGYSDGFQADGTFWYTGEGQSGDMEMVRGNRAIRDHVSEGKHLHLFEATRPGWVRYLGEVLCLGYHEARGHDRNGVFRRTLVFELATNRRTGATIPDLGIQPARGALSRRRRTLVQA